MIITLEGPGSVFVGKFFCHGDGRPTFSNHPVQFPTNCYDITSLLLEHIDELCNCNVLLFSGGGDPEFNMLFDMRAKLHRPFSYLAMQVRRRLVEMYICRDDTGWVNNRLKSMADVIGTCKSDGNSVEVCLMDKRKGEERKLTIKKSEYQWLDDN